MVERVPRMAAAIAMKTQNRGNDSTKIQKGPPDIVKVQAEKTNTMGSPVEVVVQQEEEDTMVVEEGMKARKIQVAMTITIQMKVEIVAVTTFTILVEVVAMTSTMVAREKAPPEDITEGEEAVATNPTRTQTTTVSEPMTSVGFRPRQEGLPSAFVSVDYDDYFNWDKPQKPNDPYSDDNCKCRLISDPGGFCC
jgi:hypothetical protein